MRILVITKRQYMGKDLLDNEYGRFFEIPAYLARRGHRVHGIALSYRRRASGRFCWPHLPNFQWESVNLSAALGLPAYIQTLTRTVRTFQPEVIWACSDSYHAIVAWGVLKQLGIPYVIDLYDNFESYGASRVPGVIRALTASCRSAVGLTVISRTLADHVSRRYKAECPIIVLGNAVRKDLFQPSRRSSARTRFRLPQNARLVGTAGTLNKKHGIDDLFNAFIALAEEVPELWLVIAGPRDNVPRRYSHDRIIDMGNLPYSDVPALLAALDVAVVSNRDTSFGRFCFPQKLYEIVACGVPVVAADVGESRSLLANHPESLYETGSPRSLVETLRAQLRSPQVVTDIHIPTWDDRASELEALLDKVLN